MRALSAALLFLAAGHGALPLAVPVSAAAAPIHVATDGNDALDGSLARAGAAGKGPVRTLERAAALARLARQQTRAPVEIVLASGTYVLSRPFELGAADSGTPEAPVVYRAAEAGKVAFSGGVAIKGWQPAAGGEWRAPVDLAAFGAKCPSQLFVDGARRERPQWPREGTAETLTDKAIRSKTKPYTSQIGVEPLNLPATWRVSRETEFMMFNAWRASRFFADGYDAATDTLTLRGVLEIRPSRHRSNVPFILDNVAVDRLDRGTWQCDRDRAEIRYAPLDGEDLRAVPVVAPRLDRLLVVKGSDGDRVHDIRFVGIAFEYAGWRLPEKGWFPTQAEYGLTSAIEAQYCASIAFSRIEVRHTGAAAINIGKACTDSEVSDSSFRDLGGGAITVGLDQRRPEPDSDWTGGQTSPVATSNIRILRNRIDGIGRIQKAGVGIRSAQADHITIAGNDIRDSFYSGISVGWFFHDKPNLSFDNLVEGNTIADYGQGYLSDMGGIYTLGRQQGTVVRSNHISGGHSRDYGGIGIYADQGSSGITFADNSVSDTSHASIMTHKVGQLRFVGNRLSRYGSAAIECYGYGPQTDLTFVDTVIAPSKRGAIERGCTRKGIVFEPPLAN